jgi:hypothetical protein
LLPSTRLLAGSGAEAWVQHYGGFTSAIDRLTELATDANGDVVVTGHTDLAGFYYRDIATVKYAGNGTAVWTNRYRPTGDTYTYPESCSVAVNRITGVSYVAGHSHRPTAGYDFFLVAYSSAGTPLWTNRYESSGDQLARAMVVDDSTGNIYVTGRTIGLDDAWDFVTVAWSSAGAFLWSSRYDGPASDDGVALAVDHASGQVYVAGTSAGVSSFQDFATVAYSSAGIALWTNRFNGPSNYTDTVVDVAVDSGSGNVLVLGQAMAGSNNGEYVTIAYTSIGTPLWTNRFNDPENGVVASALAVEGQSGQVYVTGSTYTGVLTGYDFATVAYNRMGTALWTNWYDDPIHAADDVAREIAANPMTGQVYVTGFVYSDTALRSGATIAYSAAGTALWTNRCTTGAEGGEPMGLGVDAATGRVFVGTRTSDYVTLAYSAAGLPAWTNFYNGPRETGETPQALAWNGTNQTLYVTGYFRNNPTDTYGDDMVTVAYSGAGVALWTNRFNGPLNQNDRAKALAVDENSGRIYVAGATTFSALYTDFTVLTYSAAGVLLRTNRYNGSGNFHDEATAIVVDQTSGRFYATGFSTGNGNTYSDFTTIAYSNSGTQLWMNRYDPGFNRHDVALALAVDQSNGNIYVTGTSEDNSGQEDIATVAYSSAGARLWTNRYDGPFFGENSPAAIAVNRSNGNVYVAGYAATTAYGIYDMVTLAYSSSGTPLWTNLFDYDPSPSYDGLDFARALAVDENNGHVYVAGRFDHASIGVRLMGVLAYSSGGSLIWSNSYRAADDSGGQATAVAVDAGGNVYVTGYSGTNHTDYVTLVYSSAGVALATNRYRGPAGKNDQPTTRFCLATAGGAAFVTGYSVTSTEETDFTTIKYVFSPEITLQPVSHTNDVGTTASFNVAAIGMQPLSYFWRHGTTPLADDDKIAGAATADLSLSNLWFTDAGAYSVLVSNAIGSTLSLPAILVVTGVPPTFNQIARLPNGTVQLAGSAAANAHLYLETSTNLFNWRYLAEFTNSSAFSLNDSNAVHEPHRFYRATWLP